MSQRNPSTPCSHLQSQRQTVGLHCPVEPSQAMSRVTAITNNVTQRRPGLFFFRVSNKASQPLNTNTPPPMLMLMPPNASRASQTVRRPLRASRVKQASGSKNATARSRPRGSTTLFCQETLWLRARGHANPWAIDGLEHPSRGDHGYSRLVSKGMCTELQCPMRSSTEGLELAEPIAGRHWMARVFEHLDRGVKRKRFLKNQWRMALHTGVSSLG